MRLQYASLLKKSASTSAWSGVTGPADLDEPPPDVERRPLRERLRGTLRTVRGTLGGLRNVAGLTWHTSRGLSIALLAVSAVLGLAPAATAVTVQAVTNTVVGHDPGRMRQLIWLVAAQFVVLVLQAAGTAARTVVERLLQERVSLTIRLSIMDRAGGLDLAFFEQSESYDLLRQTQQEASLRPVSVITTVMNLIQTLVTFLSMIGLLAALSPVIALLGLLAPVPAFIADGRFSRRSFTLAQWAAPAKRRMQYLVDLVTSDSAAKEVKVFGLSRYLTHRFALLGMGIYRRERGLVVRRYLAYAGWGTISTLVGSLTYLFVAVQTVRGVLTVGDLVLYATAVTSVQVGVQTIFRSMVSIHEDNLYLQLLEKLLATPVRRLSPRVPQDAGTGAAQPLSTGSGEVRFEHVSFTYPGTDQTVLHDVCLTLHAGETVALVGVNGAGKSTLVKLLCGLYRPTTGRITLDGVDLEELGTERLWPLIGAMFQDYVRYQATAAENIGLGSVADLADRQKIATAARDGGADGLVARLPRGFDQPLGKWFDQGTELSGGEWQKIALSRAFMRQGRVLVLDEPTSALDPRAEHDLFTRLARLTADRTTLYVSHRFSTVRRADRIVLLEDGVVREDGRHEELMAHGGEYARLFTLQARSYVDLPGDDSAARPREAAK